MEDYHVKYFSKVSSTGKSGSSSIGKHSRSLARYTFVVDDYRDRALNQSIDKLEQVRSSVNTKVKSKFFCYGIKYKDSRFEETYKSQPEGNTLYQYEDEDYGSLPDSRRYADRSSFFVEQPTNPKATDDQDFLGFMDTYLTRLATPKRLTYRRSQERANPADTVRLQRKLELYEKKFKEMQISSSMEVPIASMQIKKLRSKDVQMRAKIDQLENYLAELTLYLEQERIERKNFEFLFSEFQSKMRLLKRPKPMHRYSQYQYPELTEESLPAIDAIDIESETEFLQDQRLKRKTPTNTTKSQNRYYEYNRNQMNGRFFRTKRLIDMDNGEEEQEEE